MSVLPALVHMPGFDCCNKLLFCECEKLCRDCLNMPTIKRICYGFYRSFISSITAGVLCMARASGAVGLVAERWTHCRAAAL